MPKDDIPAAADLPPEVQQLQDETVAQPAPGRLLELAHELEARLRARRMAAEQRAGSVDHEATCRLDQSSIG
jgi:hypothetical protein